MAVLSESGVAVRLAATGDERVIVQLAQLSFAEYDPSAAATTQRLLGERGARTFVAERRGAVLGFVVVGPKQPTLMAVNAIAVAPSERGKRVGQRLMLEAERYARRRGASALTLCTAQANVAALDLFLRSGFTITDRSTVRYFGGQPACLLLKSLT